MFIEVHGPECMLDEIRLHFEDELQRAGYGTGLRLGSMDAGTLISYVQGDKIISIQVTEESEAGDSALKIEAESEITEIYELWDAALINYGRKMMSRLMNFARDKIETGTGVEIMEIFPNWTFIPIVFFLIVLTFILNRTLFRPLGKIIRRKTSTDRRSPAGSRTNPESFSGESLGIRSASERGKTGR